MNSIIEKLEKIYQLNDSLLTLSKDKTERLKANDIEAFNDLLMKERKHVQAIEQIEAKREQETKAWFELNAPHIEEQTMTSLIEQVDDQEQKRELEDLFEKLVFVLADLKQQEQLNRDLTQQSLQFVELTLDMLRPNHQKDLNYQKPKAQDSKRSGQSVFDSKA
ncbi:flagellar protein FlgN [Alkalibacillus aidingensis]|uniref:flagellar protein FlgN n=1 Tax=Alkalibacillus aidingensis TaxID=2747607 RepID=UPI001CB6C5C4|nr:flagellar protein FlgN [Alkalibacillus aidingensis]